jgi:hydrogenase nickel incorporation protein HypB
MGAPGVGKTSTIIALTEHLPDWHHYVVEGDIESDIDTRTLRQLGVETLQINTHGACHLESHQIDQVMSDFDFCGPGLMLIENIGNLVCPAEMVIGEHVKLLIVTTTDGSDKPYKYPLAFEKADLILINKADLLPYVDFDRAFFMAGVRALNPTAPVLEVSARNRMGFEPVAEWIRQRADLLLP